MLERLFLGSSGVPVVCAVCCQLHTGIVRCAEQMAAKSRLAHFDQLTQREKWVLYRPAKVKIIRNVKISSKPWVSSSLVFASSLKWESEAMTTKMKILLCWWVKHSLRFDTDITHKYDSFSIKAHVRMLLFAFHSYMPLPYAWQFVLSCVTLNWLWVPYSYRYFVESLVRKSKSFMVQNCIFTVSKPVDIWS